MTQIIVDEVLKSKLNGLTQLLELCDAEGRVVARVIPVPAPQPLSEGLEPPLEAGKNVKVKRKQEKKQNVHHGGKGGAHLEKNW